MNKYDKIDWILIAVTLGVGILLIELGYKNGLQFIPILVFYLIRYWRYKGKKRGEK